MADVYTRPAPGGRALWHTERLWQLSEGLPVRQVPLNEIVEFDEDCWFQARHAPTCRAIADHARRIRDADMTYPVILSADGRLMDGGHRIGRASRIGPQRGYVVDGSPSDRLGSTLSSAYPVAGSISRLNST
jgi:hypothetical protein